jgi:hypothetical protein
MLAARLMAKGSWMTQRRKTREGRSLAEPEAGRGFPAGTQPALRGSRAFRAIRGESPVYFALLSLGALYVFLLATRVGPLDGVWSIDQGVRIEQIQSLLLTRFRSLATVYPGQPIDPKLQFTPLLGQYLFQNGRSYSMFSTAWAALSSLPYRLFSYPGLYVIPVVATLLLLFCAGRLTRPLLSPGARAVLILSLGLTTPLCFYSLVFWDHALVAMLAMLALWGALPDGSRRESGRLLAAGAALGISVWFRPETFLAIPALGAAVWTTGERARGRSLVALAAGGGATLAPLLLFNRFAYGVLAGPHVAVVTPVLQLEASVGSHFHRRMEWAAAVLAPPWRSVLAAIGAILALRVLYGWTSRPGQRRLLVTLSAVALVLVGVQLVRHDDWFSQTSLLLTAPLALLCLLPWAAGGGHAVRSHNGAGGANLPHASPAARLGRGLAVFAALFLALAWLVGLPEGGSQWGPRMLLPAIAPLVVSGFLRLVDWTRHPLPGIASVALVASFAMLAAAGGHSQYRGIAAVRLANENSRRFSDVVLESKQRVVVCSDTAVPKLLAPIFYRGDFIFRAETPERLGRLLPNLRQAGFRELLLIDHLEKPVLGLPSDTAPFATTGTAQGLPFGYRATVVRIP